MRVCEKSGCSWTRASGGATGCFAISPSTSFRGSSWCLFNPSVLETVGVLVEGVLRAVLVAPCLVRLWESVSQAFRPAIWRTARSVDVHGPACPADPATASRLHRGAAPHFVRSDRWPPAVVRYCPPIYLDTNAHDPLLNLSTPSPRRRPPHHPTFVTIPTRLPARMPRSSMRMSFAQSSSECRDDSRRVPSSPSSSRLAQTPPHPRASSSKPSNSSSRCPSPSRPRALLAERRVSRSQSLIHAGRPRPEKLRTSCLSSPQDLPGVDHNRHRPLRSKAAFPACRHYCGGCGQCSGQCKASSGSR